MASARTREVGARVRRGNSLGGYSAGQAFCLDSLIQLFSHSPFALTRPTNKFLAVNDSTASPASLEALRERLGQRYYIERELGRGGMGAVYLARDVRLDRLVALKVLPPEFAVQATLRDRFLRETRTAASFSHPNIVPVYAVEESEDFLAYAMGYVEGESLMERVRRAGPLSVRETVKLMQDVAYALAYAHGRGIVHRDIKPDNIMIDRASGRALVMDFGIARAKSNAPVATTSAGLTRVGEVVGTPEYMSPEQASGDEVDGRSDLYSLGLAVMFALTGKQAVSAETTQKVLVKQLTEHLPSITTQRADLPDALAAAVDRCVLKDPAQRFPTAEGLVEALDVAQLAAPEIPLSIRLFAQEASSLLFVASGAFFGIAFIVRSRGHEDQGLTILLSVLLLSILFARFMQTFREAHRLAVTGFGTDEIISGMTRVVDERAVRRAELLADPLVVSARRKTVIASVFMLAGAFLLLRVAMAMRTFVREDYYLMGPGALAMLFSAASLLGVSLVLLLKSPLRMPAGERLFRWLWLGPLGRAFVRFGGRKAKGPAGSVVVSGTGAVQRRPLTAPARPVSSVPPMSALPGAGPAEQASASDEVWSAHDDREVRASVAKALRGMEERVAKIESRLGDLERRG